MFRKAINDDRAFQDLSLLVSGGSFGMALVLGSLAIPLFLLFPPAGIALWVVSGLCVITSIGAFIIAVTELALNKATTPAPMNSHADIKKSLIETEFVDKRSKNSGSSNVEMPSMERPCSKPIPVVKNVRPPSASQSSSFGWIKATGCNGVS